MEEFPIAEVISAILIGGLLIGWLALVRRRYRELGPMEPLRDRQWFIEVFKEGWKALRHCRWIMRFLLLAAIISFAESQIRTHIYLKKHPELLQRIPDLYGHRKSLSSLLGSLIHFLPYDFLRTAGNLDSAMFKGFASMFVMICFITGITIVLFRSIPAGAEMTDNDSSLGKRKLLGVAAGASSMFLIFLFVKSFISGSGAFTFWMFLPTSLVGILFSAFKFSTFLPAIEAAGRDKDISFLEALSQSDNLIRSLFFYVVVIAAISAASSLSLYFMMATGGSSVGMGRLFQYNEAAKNILCAMLCFVPVIIVVQKASFKSAFIRCIDLWARQAKSAAVFLLISTLLLLVPNMLEGRLWNFFSYRGLASYAIQILFTLYKVSVGVLIMSSMVVFYKKIQESEEEGSQGISHPQ